MHEYSTRAQLADGLSAGVGAVLAGGIATAGQAILAVSGGSTPALFFERLSEADIAWEQVTILPVDERFVEASHPRSNLGLINRNLAKNRARAARVHPLYLGGNADVRIAAEQSDRAVAQLPALDAAILGMGGDGHTASLFPRGDRLAAALDLANPHHVEAMIAPGADEPRLTLTLHRLLGAGFIALHIEGADKRRAFDTALGDGPAGDMPVRAVLRGAGDRLRVFWAP